MLESNLNFCLDKRHVAKFIWLTAFNLGVLFWKEKKYFQKAFVMKMHPTRNWKISTDTSRTFPIPTNQRCPIT